MKTNNQWLKRLAAMFLSIAMVFCFTPVTTHALFNFGTVKSSVDRSDVTGLGTESSPYIVKNWDGLAACLTADGNEEGGDTVYVKLGNIYSNQNVSDIVIAAQDNCSNYVLDLNGKLWTIKTTADQPFTISENATLTLKSSMAGGAIYDNTEGERIFHVDGGRLNVYSGTYNAKKSKYVMHRETGSLDIYGGVFIASNAKGSVICARRYGTELVIRKGTFIQESDDPNAAVISSRARIFDYGKVPVISLDSRTDQIIFKRTNSSGILVESTDYLINLHEGSKENSFDYWLDGKWISEKIDDVKTVEGSELRVSYHPEEKPVIVTQPSDITVKMYEEASFYVGATGVETYEWVVCDADSGQPYDKSFVEEHANVDGWYSNQLHITPTDLELNGLAVTCTLYNELGYTYTNDAILTVNGGPPIITSQPKAASTEVGKTATFEVSVLGDYQRGEWVICDGGGQEYTSAEIGAHATVTGWYDETLNITPKDSYLDGSRIYFYAENEYGYVESDYAYLTIINSKPVITSQPQDTTVNLYGTATFTVTGTNVDSYQWYVVDYDNGQPYSQSFIEQNADVSGWNSSTFTISPKNIQLNGLGIYCQLSNDSGNTYSETALLTVNEPSNKFTDVDNNSVFYEPIMWAVENKITTGTTDTTFSPNDKVTRAQVALFLWRAAGCPEPKTTTSSFVDVKDSGATKTFYKAILWAAENKITSGTDTTHFSPQATCSRAQIVTFLYRYAGSPAVTTTTNPFTDVSKTGYTSAFYDAIMWAVENKITTGITNTTFSPRTTCTRAQVVTFLYRLLK